MDKIKVLYIDDEPSNLEAFKASFRRTFNIYTAESANEGYKILGEQQIEVVIADQRMPTVTGVDFFESIIGTYPNPIRILLTGYSDIEAIIAGINKGQIYQYVTKPWNEYDLKLIIENAYHLYHLKEQNNKLNIKYRKVFSDSSDPIVLFDLKGRIVDYNKAALNLFDTKEKKLNMVSFNSLIKDKIDVEKIIEALNTKGIINGFECQVYGKNNEIRSCLLSANKISNNYGETISYQAILKDITKHLKMNQILIKTVIETQEDERERISRDLHDSLGQSLAGIKLHLEALKMEFKSKGNDLTNLDKLPKLLQGAIDELRRICYNTLPPVLYDYGLVMAIKELVRKLEIPNFSVIFDDSIELPPLEKSVEIAVFRIIQEFINNSIKHSKATKILIDLKNKDGNLLLNLKDNGIGFNINDLTLHKGQGLKNITTRIKSFNGNVNINSILNQGTEFDIAIPIILN